MAHMNVEDFLYLETAHGTIIIEMLPEIAPLHVNQIRTLINQKFYDGLVFHRVIEGFMVQGGCPKGDGTGGVTPEIPAEFSDLKHERGVCSMARSADPNSASCQFFICLDNVASLDGQYTIWGRVVKGLEYIDLIKKGDPSNNGSVENPDIIKSMRMATDIPVDYKPQ